MISFLKNRMLLRGLICRPSFRFTDLQRELGQHIERNKAILASKIITIIEKSPLNQYRSGEPCLSLRQNILQQIDTYNIDSQSNPMQQKITSAVRYALRRYFVGGVFVPHHMCRQNRFNQDLETYSEIKARKEEVEIKVDTSNDIQYEKDQFHKLQFCPTYFITGQIFRKIIPGKRYQFITGQYGVGKTYSFILYTLLSEIIFRYRYQFNPTKKMSQLHPSIRRDIPKAFYWCVNKSSDYHEPGQVNKLINRQFYELKDVKEWTGDIMSQQNSYGIANLLGSFQIKTVLLMDQISELAAIVRDLLTNKIQILSYIVKAANNKENLQTPQCQKLMEASLKYMGKTKEFNVESLRTLDKVNILIKLYFPPNLRLPQSLESQKKQKQNDYFKKFKSYKNLIHKIIEKKHFNRLIYLSSVDIQRHLLNQLQLIGPSKQGYVQDYMERIWYPFSLYGDLLISDTAEFIKFCLRQKINKIQNRDPLPSEDQLLIMVKKQLQMYLSKQEFAFFLPLSIRKTIQDFPNINFQNCETKQQKYKLISKMIQQLMKSIQIKSVQQMGLKLNEFLSKKLPTDQLDHMKYVILSNLWARAENICKQFIQSHEKIKQNEKMKKGSVQEKRNETLLNFSKFQIELPKEELNIRLMPTMPHTLFGFNYSYLKLQCFVNPIVLKKIILSREEQIYSGLLEIQEDLFDLVVEDKSSCGNLIEKLWMAILPSGGTSLKIKLSSQMNKQLNFQNISQKIGGFVPIQKNDNNKPSNYKFLKSFIKNLETLHQQNNGAGLKNLFLRPVKRIWYKNPQEILAHKINNQNRDQYFTSTSKLIDFVICQSFKSDMDLSVSVNVIDPTIQLLGGEASKVLRFFEELINFKDQYDSISINGDYCKVWVNYIVFTNKDVSNFNCKNIIQAATDQLEKSIQNMQPSQKKNAHIQLQKRKEFQLRDFGNSCEVLMNQKYESGKQVVNRISVVNMFTDTEIKCENKLKFNLRLRLLKKIQKALQKREK